MNGYYIAAGGLLVAAFFVHTIRGNRFYSAARPGRGADPESPSGPDRSAAPDLPGRPDRPAAPGRSDFSRRSEIDRKNASDRNGIPDASARCLSESHSCPDRPDRRASVGYEAWLMGRCGVQMITVDLALGALFLLLSGFGILPRNFALELFLALTYGGWFLFWLVSLAAERASKARYLRLCHWALFLTLAALVLLGMRA